MTDTHNIFEVMENCKKRNGYYPISFSYPKLHLKSKNKSRALSAPPETKTLICVQSSGICIFIIYMSSLILSISFWVR